MISILSLFKGARSKGRRKELEILASESCSAATSRYSPAIEGLQEWLRLQLATPAAASRETRAFRDGRIAGLREAVIWLKKLETVAVIDCAKRN